MRTVLVSGPPCAGKTTYILNQMEPRDYVLDRDRLELALTASLEPELSDHGSLVASAFYGVLSRAREFASEATLWVQECAPERSTRQRYRDMHGAHVVVLATDAETCRSRALDKWGGESTNYAQAIDAWWRRYQPDSRDRVIREPIDLSQAVPWRR